MYPKPERQAMSPSTSMSSRIWRAGAGIVAVGVLATGCAAGTRAAPPGTDGSIPAQVAPVTVPTGTAPAVPARPVAPAAGTPVDPAAAAQDPQATADIQAADQSLSQIETDLSNVDQAAASGENDVPGN